MGVRSILSRILQVFLHDDSDEFEKKLFENLEIPVKNVSKNEISSHVICPVCFGFCSKDKINPEWPMCGECASEAMDIEVVPLEQFLENHSLDQFQKMLDDWNETEGFRECYKKWKTGNIKQVIDLKLQF